MEDFKMSVSGIGTPHYPAWREMGKAQRNNSGTGFAGRMAGADTAESFSSQRASVKAAGQYDGQAVPGLGAWNHEL